MLGNVIAIIALIALSAFFSASETAFASASELRMRNAAERGGHLSKWAYRIQQEYDPALTTILIGNNLVNNAASTVATMIIIGLLGNGYAWVATVVITVLLLIFGEIIPKVLTNQAAEQVAMAVAAPLRILMFITRPIVWLTQGALGLVTKHWKHAPPPNGPSVTEDDLEVILDTVEDEGIIDEDTTELLQSALDFDDVLAYEIITPRVDIVAIDIEDDYDDILQTALSSPFSRIPVYEGSIDNVIGILHLNRLLKRMVDDPTPDLRDLVMPVNFVHKTMPLPSVLATMKRLKCHMVIVGDEYGGTMGLLTMEDVLEQLVGDIWDESDEIVDEFREMSPGKYEVDGDMRLLDFFSELDIDDRDFDNDNATVGGWSIEMIGGFPAVGDMFVYKNITVAVQRVLNRRATRLQVEVHEPIVSDDDE